MRKFLTALIVFGGLVFSCTNAKDDSHMVENKNNEHGYVELDSFEMNEISLLDYDLNMSLMVPIIGSASGTEIKPEIIHDDGDYLWYINIGKYFHLVIEDYAKEFNKVTTEKKRIAAKKDIFKVEYIIDRNNLIFYKRNLLADQGGKSTFHCYGEIRIDGYNFVLRSEKSGSYQPIIQDMVTTIKSAKKSVK